MRFTTSKAFGYKIATLRGIPELLAMVAYRKGGSLTVGFKIDVEVKDVSNIG